MNKRNNIIQSVFLLFVFTITVYLVFKGQDLAKMMEYIRQANISYWFLAIICVFLFIAGESVIIFYMMRSLGQKVQMSHCLLYSFVGFFFSCLTPGATGGQPMQIYYMKKDKFPVSLCTLVLMIVTITYKLVLVVLGAVVFLFRPPTIMHYLQPVIGWCYLGILLNVICIVSMFILVFHPTLAGSIVNLVVRILGRLHITKRSEKLQKKVDKAILQYQDVADYFRTHKIVIWNAFCITLVQRFLLFFVLYLTYRSFGFDKLSMVVVTSLQGMIAVAVDMLPLPGGMGITERLFVGIFQPHFESMTLAVMVVSRGLSFYSELLISAVFTVVAHLTIGREKNDRVL